MSKLDTNFVKQLYSSKGVELTPEKLQYISENYASNEELESSFNMKYAEPQEPKTDPEKKNQNSTTTSTKTPSVSPTQQRERKPTSVGGKPIQTGASASSAGKSEDLINKFGFKDKEEQKKAGVKASKTKVDVKTPFAIKSVSVKKEQFDKPEIKEAKREASLFKQEVKREEEKVFVNDFRNATALPENYEQQVIEEVNNEVQGKGVWNTITQGASNVWNKILPYIPGAPSSKEEVEQLKSDITFLPKAKEEYKKTLLKQGVKEDEITDDILTEGAINLEVKKRVEDKKLSLANDYLDNLDNDTKDRMKINSSNQIGIKSPEVNKQFDILKALDLDIKEDNSELVELEKLAKNNGSLSPEDLDRYNILSAELPLKINTRTKLYKNYEKNLSELTTAEEEYDLFKRSYGFEDKAGKLLNAVSDFGLGVLQLANVAKGGPMQDITAMQIAELKNDKDRFVAEKLQKQVKDSKNLNDILDYGSDVLISQTPNIALGYLTGGTSMMYGIGASSAGNKYSELVTSNSEGSTDYSKLQMVLASGLYGASEMLESNTLKMIGGGKSIISKALKNEPSRKLFKESLSTKTFNAGKEFVKNYTGELKEELTTYGAQKITDIVVLDLESKDVFKNAKQEVKSLVKDTGVMVVGLNLFPTAIAKVANAFSPKDYTYNLDKNNKEIEELSKILNNKEASEVVRLEAKSKIDKIVKANEDGLTKIIQNTAKLDDKLIDKVIDIEIASSDLRNKANQINEDKTISKDQKAVLLSGLKDEFIKNESLREDIVSGRKSSFDILPEEEQTKFKTEAAEAIIQEQVDKGIEKDNIQEPNAEVINKKAKELYNQKIEEDAKTKQTDGQITSEEKPATTTEEQAVSTTQQEDGVQLQPQEEINGLREAEINELKDNVENPEQFIIDGKIDAKKVSESDNAKAKEIYAKYDAQIKPLLDNIKTQEDAIQEQITDEGVLQPGQSEMGLQEMEQGDTKQEVVAEQGQEEKVKLQEDVKKASDRLSKAYDAYKNIGIVFDPEGNWKKDKELVSSLVEFAVSNIKFGAYNAKVLIEDLAKKGIEISKENAKYIFDKANKKFKSDINKAVGIKPKATEQKRIDKAFGVGVATQKVETQAQKEKVKSAKEELSTAKKEIQDVFSAAKEALKIEKDRNKVINKLKVDANAFIKASITDLKAGDIGNRAITSIASKIQSITGQNFEEKLLEINTVLDNLYTNRDVNTAKADSKKAFKNVMSGKVGKLDERGDRDKVMSSKIVNFTKLEPKTLKKVIDEADFEQYKDYIGRLSGRGLTLSETDLKAIGELYDRISKPYSDYVAEVNRIQQIIDAGGTLTKDESDFIENNSSDFSERETPETLADKEEKKLAKDAKKEEEIAKKKASIKELLPSIKSVFESSNAVKGSLEWRMLNSLIGLSESDVDSMPDNMLTNALNAISSMVNDDVIPAYAEDLYKYKLKTDYKNALVETLKKSGKAGVYKLKVAKIPLKIREIIGLPLMSLIKGINQKNIDQQVIDRRIKFFNLSAIDAAVKVYGDTPLFNAFMSSFGKAMSRIASAEEKVEAVLLSAKRDIDKNSKNPQESYMKIVYHLIDTMAKNNVGTTSSISAMEYFEATVSDPNSKISEDNYMKGLVNGFIDKVKENDNQIEDLTPEEANAANAIRMVLEENQINAYEANLFQNSNAAPMIVEYYPVFNSVVKQAENDLARLKSKFGIDSVSIKAGNLEDKTGTAHPIDLNPFTSAFSSVRNVLFQHQLRSEYAAITQAINEAIAENSKDNDVLPYLKGIQKALNSQFDLLINGAVHTEPTLTDKILNGTDRAFYTLALGSIISRGVDFAGNMVQLMTINPKYISYSNKVSNALMNVKEDGESETELIRSFYENAEASDINKMISSKKINTERTEFINRGINKEVLSKGLPESNSGVKLRAKITGPIRDTASGAVDTLLGFGDVKPYAISWNGVFYEEFLKQTGEDVNVEKIARGDVEYLKKYKDAISKASNKANQENADLYGSTNPMEKKVGIMEIASKQVKNSVPGAVNALVNKAAYLFASFDMNARNDMNTAVNTYIENKEGRNARRFLGGAIRLASYSLVINYITGAIWGLFKGDDDDEEKLKVSFDKLSGDDDFIKEVNNSLLDYPIQKDADGNIIELTRDDLVKYNKMRDKLMQNKDFAAAYDIVYGYVNRDLFDNQVKNKIGEINSGKYEYDKSLVEVFFSDMDKGFGKSDDEIIGVLGLLNSQQGYKLFTQDQIDSYILKLEKYMSDTKFLSNRAIRESNKQIDRLIITKTASILSDYRSNKSIGDITTTEGLKLFMGMMLSRSNNFTKAAYNYAAELSNKQLIQARRGERGYDAFKDNVFQTPVKAGLTEKASKQQLIQDVFNILFPALTKMDRYMATDYAIPDLVRFTPLGILGVNDFSKIDSKMRNDVIYQNTNGKYRENIIKDIEESKIDILRSKEDIEKDSTDNQFRKSRVIPGVKETQLKSRFPSYKEGKDLKVNGNRAN